ncbi:MAG: PH domain-containing protein [Acidobacteriota bacterium]
MADTIIRPTLKWVRFGYTLWFLIAFVAIFAWNNYLPDRPFWPVAVGVAALWALWPLRLQILRRLTRITIAGDKLRYEAGLFSKTTRTLQLAKIQDVTVNQSLGQRMLGIGDLSIETAGETSRLTIRNIDQPQELADQILDWSHEQQPKRKGDRG